MKRLKAGALQLVTFIIVVIALLLSSFLILTHVHKQFRLQTSHVIESVRLVDQGVFYTLSQSNKIADTLTIPVFDEDYKSLKSKTSFWGVFEQVYAEVQIKNKTLKKTALVGSQQTNPKTALFLKDNNRPLVIVGHTEINGLAYLPKRGIKSGNISGHSYYGTQHVNGIIKESQKFPMLDVSLQKHINALVELPIGNQKEVDYLDINANRKTVNSFSTKLKLVYSDKTIVLSEIELSGHVIIQSDIKIIVEETSKLVDVILIAPSIEIKKNVEGTFQAFATNKISVSENVKLDYPSALVLYGDYKKNDLYQEHILEINANTQIKGSVLCIGNTTPDNYDSQLKIDANVVIEGEVYCEQNLELKGTVYGSVYTNNFIVKEGGTTYQNHLYNGKVNSKELTKHYVGLVLDNRPKQIMKWLY
ncbi:hypothetical protein A9Q86_01540 [Flavobacteriales bacterium 33_180_T64]|nr:hypothetical protein A9Q86_01540 [Flavobacteriales bacterium 33_180_T64]